MTAFYNNYLKFKIPLGWCTEENEDTLLIYKPDGEGAIVTSFLSLLDADTSLEEKMCIMAKKFIDKNNIKLNEPLILANTQYKKVVLRGTGKTSDGWFIGIWLIAKQPKVVIASYQAAKRTKEFEVCNSIIESMEFSF